MEDKLTYLLNLIEDKFLNIRFSGNVPSLYEPIIYSLENKGKRIRPLLCLISYLLFDNKVEKALDVAVGIEVFHNFTLIHDDIMDNSLYRRNKLTVHAKWNKNVAILSGDAMMIKSFEFFIGKNKNLQKEFINTALKVCEGQQLDMEFENKELISLTEYIKMISLKTAELIAFSLKAGGIIANANKNDIDNLYNLGLNLGIMFQIQDDYLDVFGDYSKFGKKIGQDIIDSKKTLLYILCLNNVNSIEKSYFINLYNDRSTDPDQKVNTIKKLYESYNIESEVNNILKEYYDKVNMFIKCFEGYLNVDLLKYVVAKMLKREK
ncbi:MAG: polyprenyl synthetase family protein [Bacteroidales bacterium]|nr:polyprenyl synthetase family protein [Bacteroidales bacterium]